MTALLSILAVFGSALVAFGFLAACDPEGRGGRLLLLIPAGGILTIGSVIALIVSYIGG